MYLKFIFMSRKYLILSRESSRQNHGHYEQGAGEGLSVTRILLYLPRYKIVWFEKVLTARASPHHKQPTCKPILAD